MKICRFPLLFSLLLGLIRAEEDSWQQATRLGIQLQQQCNFPAAQTAFLRALKDAQQFGPEDLRLAIALNNLGSVYQDLGDHLNAEKYYQRSFLIFQKRKGLDDPVLAGPVNNLASLYLENSQWAKAERLPLRALEARLDALNPNHPLLARLRALRAMLCYGQGKYEEAELLFKQALASLEKLGSTQTIPVLNNLGLLYVKLGRDAEAKAFLERAVAIAESHPGPARPALVKSLGNLGVLNYRMYGPAQPEPCFRRALEIAHETKGVQLPVVGRISANYAMVLRELHRKAEAKEMDRRAKAIRASFASENQLGHTVDVAELAAKKR